MITEGMETLLALDDFKVKIYGKVLAELPHDLYIPPHALEIFLEAFEGPLDLLLYLIKRQNLDILDIPIAEITRQYIDYIELMKELRIDLAAEYLLMAASLAEIKSRMLLPRPASEDRDDRDPRAELIRRLQEYERFKKVAEDLDALPRFERDLFPVHVDVPRIEVAKKEPEVDFKELIFAMKDILQRADLTTHHAIRMEPLSIRERMTAVLTRLQTDKFCEFTQLFNVQEGRMGVIVSFIAILELLRQHLIALVQNQAYSPIHIKVIEHEQ
jgi:segregation and condensation protein A